MSLANKLFCRIFGDRDKENSGSASDRPNAMFNNKSEQSASAEDAVKAFVSQNPRGKYTFESIRDEPRSELCREVENKRDCILLQMYATRLNEVMQENGFYCALPADPTRTHMECRPLPKTS